MGAPDKVNDDINAFSTRNLLGFLVKVLRLVAYSMGRTVRQTQYKVDLFLGRRCRGYGVATASSTTNDRKNKLRDIRPVKPRELYRGDAHSRGASVHKDIVALLALCDQDEGLVS